MKLGDARFINSQLPSDFFHGEFLVIVKLHHLTFAFGDAAEGMIENLPLLPPVTRMKLMFLIVSDKRFFASLPGFLISH